MEIGNSDRTYMQLQWNCYKGQKKNKQKQTMNKKGIYTTDAIKKNYYS